MNLDTAVNWNHLDIYFTEGISVYPKKNFRSFLVFVIFKNEATKAVNPTGKVPIKGLINFSFLCASVFFCYSFNERATPKHTNVFHNKGNAASWGKRNNKEHVNHAVSRLQNHTEPLNRVVKVVRLTNSRVVTYLVRIRQIVIINHEHSVVGTMSRTLLLDDFFFSSNDWFLIFSFYFN